MYQIHASGHIAAEYQHLGWLQNWVRRGIHNWLLSDTEIAELLETHHSVEVNGFTFVNTDIPSDIYTEYYPEINGSPYGPFYIARSEQRALGIGRGRTESEAIHNLINNAIDVPNTPYLYAVLRSNGQWHVNRIKDGTTYAITINRDRAVKRMRQHEKIKRDGLRYVSDATLERL